MMNYCQCPESGELVYRCGFGPASRKSPIGICRFAVDRCPILLSWCDYYACGFCMNLHAQQNADDIRRKKGK